MPPLPLRSMPLVIALSLRLPGWLKRRMRPEHRPGPWSPGLTVVIPDRATPDLLAECLDALMPALARVDEPWQVLVSASAAAPALYADIAERHRCVEWRFSAEPLGYSRAIAQALGDIGYDHTYLLNNDMRLDPDALTRVLEHRAADVFAIASQIFMADPSRRREETGLTACAGFASGTSLFDVDPGGSDEIRPHLYAGGGSSLFRTALLRDYARQSAAYEPLYWEDAEWGLRAWREGWRVLFCPASHATHRHRATVSRVFPAAEVERIFERNRCWFDLRNGTGVPLSGMLNRVGSAHPRSRQETRRLGFAVSTLAARGRASGLPVPDRWFLSRHDIRMRFGKPASGRPRLLCVTPYAVLPPDHGGARRTYELLAGLSEEFDIALVSDEAGLYPQQTQTLAPFLSSIWLVDGRPMGTGAAEDRTARMARHCWSGFREAFEHARMDFKPHVVLVEHGELAGLIALRNASECWWLDLHDVDCDPQDTTDALLRRLYADYELVLATSHEDLSLLDHAGSVLVANGSNIDPESYTPSPAGNHDVLFVGNLRYEPNLRGIREFLASAWPAVRLRVPSARLLLAGILRRDAESQLGPLGDSVECLGPQQDLLSLYASAAMTINPLQGIRGSAVKVAESLCAGRVCVSTREGARGWDADEWSALITVPDVRDMHGPLSELLLDHDRRRAIERPSPQRMKRLSWPHQVQRLMQAQAAQAIDGFRFDAAYPGRG